MAESMVIGDAITIDTLAVFLDGCDERYATPSVATTSKNGLMSSSDKTKLNGLITTLTEAQVDAAVAAAFATS